MDFLFIYLWLCWVFIAAHGLSLVAASGGHSSSRCVGFSLSRPLLLRSTGSRRAGSVIVAHGPSCSAACGIFPDQGLNLCPLHWQADSQQLHHQGSPNVWTLLCFICFWFMWFFFKDFFWCWLFLKSLLNLLQYCFCFLFWFFGRKACGILAPRPGIEPSPPPLEGEVLTAGPPGKSPLCDYFYGTFFKFYFLLTYSRITVLC